MTYILHFDLDAFFASVEQALHPALGSQPVVVSAGRGQHVITAASYQAKSYGVKTGMPLKIARQLCPAIVFVTARIEAYQRCGNAVKDLISSTGVVIESLGVDECFLDFSTIPPSFFPNDLLNDYDKITYYATWVKNAVKAHFGLNITVGVGSSKVIAKLASDTSKPDGLRILKPLDELDFLHSQPITAINGIGNRISSKLHSIGVFTVKDLSAISAKTLLLLFGPHHGKILNLIAQNSYFDPVKPNQAAKSMSVMRSFRPPRLAGESEIETSLEELLLRLNHSGRCSSRISAAVVTPSGYFFDYVNFGGATSDREILVPAFRTIFQNFPKSQILYLSLSLERLSDVEQLHLPNTLLDDHLPKVSLEVISQSDKLARLAYKGLYLSHPVFGLGLLLSMQDSALTVKFADRERVLELWAPLSY
jgi:DNA polymerase-4